jgi:hypothetical protein
MLCVLPSAQSWSNLAPLAYPPGQADTGICLTTLQLHDGIRSHDGMMQTTGAKNQPRLNMCQPAVFRLRLQGTVDESWTEYFGAQSLVVEVDAGGHAVTALTTEPVDQAGLIGIINYVNMLGLPLVSVDCLSTECQK